MNSFTHAFYILTKLAKYMIDEMLVTKLYIYTFDKQNIAKPKNNSSSLTQKSVCTKNKTNKKL